ncbi:hypothetical protein GLOTRDRAFT_131608 [Gloeophyllum trabeum ATCC 11539]|uniref:Uncharacterized protein n=1 Tax=Gloeophyllum trabeum (strain ATCC 11539 / FP-39264 / Madison 617) TaxID=670483 RepID=S7Q084_GLOTA|nr:uncharacterized protein GLOTRDRAFT_131608 [Gloeophyllum trabeum ATCC 11539]EPQ53341.1 hypothetical protein GLOTRDRAFT_131608 [Gloeophyllum trabeum ATCC 11539]
MVCPPDTDEAGQEDWDTKDSAAQAMLLNAIDNGILVKVANLKGSVWQRFSSKIALTMVERVVVLLILMPATNWFQESGSPGSDGRNMGGRVAIHGHGPDESAEPQGLLVSWRGKEEQGSKKKHRGKKRGKEKAHVAEDGEESDSDDISSCR